MGAALVLFWGLMATLGAGAAFAFLMGFRGSI